jgi:hypothetical protein
MIMVFITILYIFLSLSIVGLTIYPDSYLYFQSALVLFSKNFYDSYQFIREPGYPIFIRLLKEVSNFKILNFDYLLISSQSLMLIISFFLLLKSFEIRNSKILILIFSLGILNPVFISLSGQFLQTSLLIFATSLSSYFISEILKGKYFSKTFFLKIGFFGSLTYLVGIQVGVIYILILSILLFKILKSNEVSKYLVKYLLFVGLILITFFSWQIIKINVNQTNNTGITDAIQIVTSRTYDLGKDDMMIFQNILSFNLDERSEIELMASNSLGDNNCGLWYPTTQAYVASILEKETIAGICKSNPVRQVAYNFIDFGMKLYRISMILYIIGFIYFLITRDFRLFLISSPAYLIHMEYTLINFNMDRYGAPLYLYGIMSLGLLYSKFYEIIRLYYFKNSMDQY